MEREHVGEVPKTRSASPLPWGTAVATNSSSTSIAWVRRNIKGLCCVGGKKIDDTETVLPLSHAITAGAEASVNRAYLSRTSVVYVFCVACLFFFFSSCMYRIACIGRAHHEELEVNLQRPWAPYHWLGSKGVDVTDRQCYYFVVAIPQYMPYIIVFLILSRRLRRHGASRTVASVKGSATPSVGEKKEFSGSSASTAHPENVIGDCSAGSSSVSPTRLVRKDVSALQLLHIIAGISIALCLCGPNFLFGVVMMLLNFYLIAPLHKKASLRVSMAVMWATHVLVLLVIHHAGGYQFSWFGLGGLDNLWVPLIPWTTQYNMSVLRMISFNTDLWESVRCGEEQRQKSLSKHVRTCIACAQIRDQHHHVVTSLPPEALSCYKCRTECSRHVEEFTLRAYLGYILYLPLLMAGPISSFNAYLSYQHYSARGIKGMAIWRYGFCLLYHVVLLATLIHYVPIMAILLTPAPSASGEAEAMSAASAIAAEEAALARSGSAPVVTTSSSLASIALQKVSSASTTPTAAAAVTVSVLEQMVATEKACLFVLTLVFLWLKFKVIWRFFRFVALLDGFDPPEDMPRFFFNAVNIQCFWRDWHASFNLWIVRYMYIPMGGSRTKSLSVFPIFLFVAVWHDIDLRLIFWAMLMCIALILEISITLFFSSKRSLVIRMKRFPLMWRTLRVFGSQLALMALTLGNLVGFSIGATGTAGAVQDMFREMSFTCKMVTLCTYLCAAVISIQYKDQNAYEKHQLHIKYDLQ
ncbi:glycerol uptake protein, putative [Leishmania tarentolae]|uniref:Glycerol uptake protein, putative n=1 Tax=Leishmania tarentolae TaxID=5689 RepID=A0A640KEA2_LEITA|nr:glycerol uptake protein, putative [Leishmania tarentolae]